MIFLPGFIQAKIFRRKYMNAREMALNILMEIKVEGAFSNHTINKHLKGKMDARDENLVRELSYGVLENRIYIDYIISQSSNIRIEKIHPRILEILRIGVYQIIFMDKIPDRAAINEAVNLSKKRGHKGISGYVNGVLRNISRNKDELMKVEERDNAHYLSIKYSHPLWMVKSWVKDYGYKFTKELCQYNNRKPELNIRVNTTKIARKDLAHRLSKQGYTVGETKYANDGLIIDSPARITETEEFKLGYFFIQDESSMLVSQIADPNENSFILDLCSAPGGKSTHLGQIMNNKGLIISRDIYDHRLSLIKDNANRLGIDIIRIEKFDALKLDIDLIEKVDYCIVDAPCSGLGIIRRSPEIKWNRTEEDIEELTNIQINILNNAKRYVKPGGIIIYSTCTVGKKENMDIIDRFLRENLEFGLIGFDDLICLDEDMENSKKGYLELFPHIHNTDGFFIAKIQKNSR